MAAGCRHKMGATQRLSISLSHPSLQVAFVGQQVCILCALSSMHGPQLLTDRLLQNCQLSSAKERQLLLTGCSDNYAQGVFSNVKADPAADRKLSAGRRVINLYLLTRGPLLTTGDIACRKLQPQAARQKAGLIMLQKRGS